MRDTIYIKQKMRLSNPSSRPKRGIIFWVKIVIATVIVILIGGVLFLKFDTAAAAQFTDNVLRPVLGASRVLYLEKIFFNAQDKAQQLKYAHNSPGSPLLGTDSVAKNAAGNNLDLKAIPMMTNFTPVNNEGVWLNKPLDLFPNKEVMAYTVVRPDQNRSFAFVTVVQMDMSVMRLASVAGTEFPGGPVGKPGPGVIPKDVINSNALIAAFDGGFQYKDGQFGMIVGDVTYLPLKNDIGTLVGYKDGSIKIVNYTGQSLGDNVEFVRQNCPILVENGTISVTDPKNKAFWGRVATGTVDFYTWRSGVGVTANGNLVFAVGNNLNPETLAIALKSAGAVNAIQLDINPTWVRFNIFEPTSKSGQYTTATLMKDLKDGSKQYLNGYNKDFFYLYKK